MCCVRSFPDYGGGESRISLTEFGDSERRDPSVGRFDCVDAAEERNFDIVCEFRCDGGPREGGPREGKMSRHAGQGGAEGGKEQGMP